MSTNSTTNARVGTTTRSQRPNATAEKKSAHSPLTTDILSSPHSPRVRGNTELPSVTLGILNEIKQRLDKIEQRTERIEISQVEIRADTERLIALNNAAPISNQETADAGTSHQMIKEVYTDFLEEKRTKHLNEECQKIKRKFSQTWKHSLNQRKQAFYNFVRNRGKAELYETWTTEFPDFLPLHLRPKLRSDEREDVTNMKIEEAKLAYNNYITFMKNTAQQDKSKYMSLDEKMHSLIESKCTTDESLNVITSWWVKDCTKEEDFSHEVWQKQKNFFIRKKDEGYSKKENMLVKIIDGPTSAKTIIHEENRQKGGSKSGRKFNNQQRKKSSIHQPKPTNPNPPPRKQGPAAIKRRSDETQNRPNNYIPSPRQQNTTSNTNGNPPRLQQMQRENSQYLDHYAQPHYLNSGQQVNLPTSTSHTTQQIAPFLVNLLQQMTHPPGNPWHRGPPHFL